MLAELETSKRVEFAFGTTGDGMIFSIAVLSSSPALSYSESADEQKPKLCLVFNT